MKTTKKLIIYLVVFFLVIIICFIFLQIFAFNKKATAQEIDITITDELIAELYSYLPDRNDFNATTVYSGNYTTGMVLSFPVIANMVYNYIYTNDAFKLEIVANNEISTNKKVLYKISKENFLKTLKFMFTEEIKYTPGDFKIDYQTEAKYLNNYYYILKDNNNEENNYAIYKARTSYTVQDNKQTIKIYDYYLKCDKKSNLCYNDEILKSSNNVIRYSNNLNVDNYKKDLVTYEHIYKYRGDHFYWESSNIAK